MSRRLRIGLGAVLGAMAVGTLWYWWVESFSPLNALYQAITTITTVGFAEVEELDSSGRAFTIVLIAVGVSGVFYTIGALFEELVESQLDRFGRRRMQQRIARLEGHTIVCGFGRVGQESAGLLDDPGQVVVVEHDEGAAASALEAGFAVVVGDATDDEALEAAAVSRAGTLVACLASDADAISAVLSARQLNPSLRIVARCSSTSSEAKLVRAGADHVVNPLRLGARRMVSFALAPTVASFVDVAMHGGSLEFRLEELVVPEGSPVAGTSLLEARIRERTGALVLALHHPDGTYDVNPAPGSPLTPGVTVIMVGTVAQIEAVTAYLSTGEHLPG